VITEGRQRLYKDHDRKLQVCIVRNCITTFDFILLVFMHVIRFKDTDASVTDDSIVTVEAKFSTVAFRLCDLYCCYHSFRDQRLHQGAGPPPAAPAQHRDTL